MELSHLTKMFFMKISTVSTSMPFGEGVIMRNT